MSLPKATIDVISRTVCGETLLMPWRNNIALCDRIFILNETASFLWSKLDGTRTVDELTALVSAAFERAPARSVEGDVAAFLAAMEERGLIVWRSEA